MPARIVIVHDDFDFVDALKQTFGRDAAWYTDPIKALAALETASTVMFLVARLRFGDRQPVGLSLARLARAANPDVRVIFTGAPEHKDLALGVGELVPEPVAAADIAMIAAWLRAGLDGAA